MQHPIHPALTLKSAASALAGLVLAAAVPTLLAFALSACNRGSEIENEVGFGVIYTAGGKPAANADVKVYAVDHLPSGTVLPKGARLPDAVYSTVTDAQGRYRLDTLAKGEYNIAASQDGKRSFEDSVFISGSSSPLPSDTLDDPATFAGNVGMQPNHNSQTALVQVLGTNNFANVGEDGNFNLTGLAEGKYTARISTTLPDYTPLILHFAVQAGQVKQAPDTLRLIYTGIPIVMGLDASYDTSAGVVTLSWRKTGFKNLLEYVVLREDAEALSSNLIAIGRTRDTVYRDTLRPLFFGRRYLYQVLLRDRSRAEGVPFETQEILAVDPSTVRTFVQLKQLGSRNGEASIGDSVRFIAGFANAVRSNRKISWRVDGKLVREQGVSAGKGEDSVTISDAKAHSVTVSVEVEDAEGNTWPATSDVRFVQDPPEADAGEDAILAGGAVVALKGSAMDGFGTIVKWEWDLGLTGTFVTTSTGDTTVTLPSRANAVVRCALRVTDDDGNRDTDTVTLSTIAFVKRAARPKLPGSSGSVTGAVSVAGKIYVAEARNEGSPPVSILEYDPVKDAWALRAETFNFGELHVVGDKVYILSQERLDSFDPATYAIKSLAKPVTSKSIGWTTPKLRVGELQGRLMLVAGTDGSFPSSSLSIYDPLSDSWRNGKAVPYLPLMRTENFATSFHGGRLIILPHQGGAHNYRYDFLKDDWLEMKRPGYGEVQEPIGATGGKIYFQNHTNRTIDAFDTTKDEWTSRGYLDLVPPEGENSQIRFHLHGNTAYSLRQNSSVKTVEIRSLELEHSPPKWNTLVPLQVPHETFLSFLIEGKLFVLSRSQNVYASDPVLFEYQP